MFNKELPVVVLRSCHDVTFANDYHNELVISSLDWVRLRNK